MSDNNQWKRKISLIVSNDKGNGKDLSQFHVQFNINQNDTQTPNNAFIRIYNMSDDTSKSIQKEFTRVTLQAGYETGAFGIVFDGTIKQIRRGRINATDTYLDILAAEADLNLNFGVVNKTLAKGTKVSEQVQSYADAMDIPVGYTSYGVGNPQLIRGKVQYGMARDGMRDIARTTQTSWSVQNGKIQVIPLTGYAPGEAVKINSATGMIGLPEQTQEGISARVLLNPKIQIGTQVQIDNASIQRAQFQLHFGTTGEQERAINETLLPSIADDGFYRVLVVEHSGDTRGQEWYTDITCLTVNKTVPADKSVKAYG